MENFSDYIQSFARWFHIIAGVMWIGLLYFFNFVNAQFAGTLDGDSKKKVVPELMPRTLYWFRWGAAWTWFSGIVLLVLVFYYGGLMPSDMTSVKDAAGNKLEPANMWIHMLLGFTFLAVFLYDFLYKSPLAKNTRLITIISFLLVSLYAFSLQNCANFEWRALNIHVGAMFGTMMAFNVWFRIWPAQQKIITAIKNGEAPDGKLVALAGLRSKHNTYMSVPLIWTMMNGHTTSFSGLFDCLECCGWKFDWIILMVVVALGWHIVFQLYKKSTKVGDVKEDNKLLVIGIAVLAIIIGLSLYSKQPSPVECGTLEQGDCNLGCEWKETNCEDDPATTENENQNDCSTCIPDCGYYVDFEDCSLNVDCEWKLDPCDDDLDTSEIDESQFDCGSCEEQ